MVVTLYFICCFSFVAFNILSLSTFDRWTFVGKVMWGSEPSQQCEDVLVLLFSSLRVTQPAGMGFDFVVIVPLLPSHCGFFFLSGRGVSFLVGSSVFLSMVAQQLVVILVLLQEEMSTRPSTLPSFTRIRPEPFCRHRKKIGMHLVYHISSNLLVANKYLQRES